MYQIDQPAINARIVKQITAKPAQADSLTTLGELLSQQRQDAEVRFSALMKEAVHLAKRYGFTIRPVNCER